MPSEISIPFRLDGSNQIAVETDPNAQIRQHVMSLINTEPGERVVLGNYGIPLSDILFEGDDEMVADEVAADVRLGFQTFEPGVQLLNVSAVNGADGDGLAQVDVQYLRTDAPDNGMVGRNMNIAVISASGRVSEVVRG